MALVCSDGLCSRCYRPRAAWVTLPIFPNEEATEFAFPISQSLVEWHLVHVGDVRIPGIAVE